MQSRLVLKKQQIEMELKRGVRDQRRKQYLTARLLQIENDIRRLGFSADDIESNDFAYSADEKKLSKAYYVPLASWTSSTDKKE
jgi:hypothetical protein